MTLANHVGRPRGVAAAVLLAVAAGCAGCRALDLGRAPESDPSADAEAVSLVSYELAPGAPTLAPEPSGPLFAEPPTALPPSHFDEAVASPPAPVDAPSPGAPLRLRDLGGLEELAPEQKAPTTIDFVLQQAVASAAVIRDPGQFLSPGNPLLASPAQVASALDPEIQAAGPAGIEAALAAFDAQVATGAQWGQDSLVQSNSFFTGNVTPANILVSDSGTVYARADKATRTGGRVSLVHNWNYTPDSLPSRDFNSRYVGFVRGEVRQPLLAGRGKRFTEIAGPASVTGGALSRGVRVARLDQRVSIDRFEAQLTRLVKQSQEAYWDLWLAHEAYRLLAASRDNARGLLDRVRARQRAGLADAGAADEAQAEETLLARESAVNDALARFFDRETRLRRLIGMPAGAGRTLVPYEQPFSGDLLLDWPASVAAAGESRVELRRQRTRVETLELQAWAAGKLLKPQLDLVAGAQVNGFGDDVFSGGGGGGGSAYGSLFGGDNAGWNVGVEFSTALNRRAARAQQRRLRLELSKARQVLRAQEEEIRHELAHAYREIDRTLRAADITSRRRAAAERRLGVAEADAAAGRRSVDLVLRAQAALSEAQLGHLRSLVDYNKAILELKFREGLLLAEHQIDVERPTRLAAALPTAGPGVGLVP